MFVDKCCFLTATRILHKEGLAAFSIEEAKKKNKKK